MVKRVSRMVRTLVPALCALSALTLGACTQQNADFVPTPAPNSAGSGASKTHKTHRTPLPAVAQRASTLIGMPVRSPTGRRLGAVEDLVFNADGRVTHLVVVHTIGGGAAGALTPVPWSLAIKHLHHGTLVLKRKRFAGAPGFEPGHWPKLDSQTWSGAADAYWARTTHSKFVPVDPTTRTRPTMRL